MIHFTGVDVHEARELLAADARLPKPWERSPDTHCHDGVVLRSADEDWEYLEIVSAKDFATLLKDAGCRATLLSLNLQNSAPSLGAWAVASGATEFSLGFQDTVDPLLAEVFFRGFYSKWKDGNATDVLKPFLAGIETAKRQDPSDKRRGAPPSRMVGSGMVLWTARSLVRDSGKLLDDVKDPSRDAIAKSQLTTTQAKKWLSLEIQPRSRLNYSLLHNTQSSLFDKLEVRKTRSGSVEARVEVNVELGDHTSPWSETLELSDEVTSLKDRVTIPLFSELLRNVEEPIRTNVRVKLSVLVETGAAGRRTLDERVVHERTLPVRLHPADEWQDTDDDYIWLPSFVLPRDPVVSRIIAAAEQQLPILTDDPRRSFDGYQSVDFEDDEPAGDEDGEADEETDEKDIEATYEDEVYEHNEEADDTDETEVADGEEVDEDEADYEEVDLQVQAIWSALVYSQIRYTNPPPTYSEAGQRLRTPTQVERQGRGTCIDLALLMAACLEYVEIYPVMFLIDGHAFPGYWRSGKAHQNFVKGLNSTARVVDSGPWGWVLTKNSYPEILRLIESGDLYPIETVGISDHGVFWKALEEGAENLRSRDEFHSMIDISLARKNGITPLPIIEGEER